MISMRKICALCDEPNMRTYGLSVVIPGSAEKQKNSAKMVMRSLEALILFFILFLQILDQATYQLGLPTAARRIYTQDGTLILSIGDLIKWTITTYGMENLTLGQDQKQGQNYNHVVLLQTF